MSKDLNKKLKLGLLTLRLGVLIVMFMWTLDKFLRVDHASSLLCSLFVA